ncbi:hypothetical protein [Providencia alcalifaciens]|uniref:hypothetical protein n=1 Tax=Providencia alcalifaciens TaxID=126385 RepID=UPI001CC5E5DA|nr:hypothetical protein [Providencia alcalifaciens]CAG9410395.1 hypothetical protein NVI2019_GHJFPKLH_00606 [Providencia alcalifaciens]
MSIIKTGSVEKDSNIFLKNDLNYNVQQKYGFKNTLNSTIGCFISSVKNKLDSINEMVCRKKIIRSYHSVVEAIELKSANNDISKKSLKKIERKILEINKSNSFLDSINIKKAIKSKIKGANEPVREKISTMLGRKFGIDIYHSAEKPSSMLTPKNDFTDVQVSNRTVNSDMNDTEFLNSVKNHQMIAVDKKENRISKGSFILSKIEEVDVADDNGNNLLSLKKDTEETTEALSKLKMEFKTRENQLSLRDAYKVNKNSFK